MKWSFDTKGLSYHKRELLEALLAEEGFAGANNNVVRRRENLSEFPLSFAQQRIWILNQLEPGWHYNDPFNLRIEGALDAAVLQSVLTEIAPRHETLRASFDSLNGQPVQAIRKPFVVALPATNLSLLPEPERELKAKAIAVREGATPFDLKTGPLFRAGLLRLGPAEHILLLTFHHIVMDGWSRSIFFGKELAALYEALRSGKPSPLPEPAIQYSDYAVWQRRHMQGETLLRQLDFWKSKFLGAPALLDWPEILHDRHCKPSAADGRKW